MKNEIYKENKLIIYNGDCRDISKQIKPGTVDLIYTDPPYLAEYHYLYEWLSEAAPALLRPDGFLLVYVPPYYKYELLKTLTRHMDFYYDFILRHPGNTSMLWQKKIISGYKSMILFKQAGASVKLPRITLGLYTDDGPDKRFHKWGQSEYHVKYYIESLTKPGDLIFDPFLGGSTVGVVAKYLGRNFIGIEIEPDAYTQAVARVAGQHEKEKIKQLELKYE